MRKNITKKEITDDLYREYTPSQFKEARKYLKEAIMIPLNTFDLITLLRKYYKNDINYAIENIPYNEFQNIRFNCLYQAKYLKNKLHEIGMDAYYLGYKARLFSSPKGDEFIKEAHVSLVVPCIINGKKKKVVYDPGLKIDVPIVAFEKPKKACKGCTVKMDYTSSGDYPNYVLLSGVNKYSYHQDAHDVYQECNINYINTDPFEIYYDSVYRVLPGYKATLFH